MGIGASAGGLESLERLFSHMPRHSGMAFIVIQHLSPDFKSVIDELLARRTRIPILQAAEGVAVESDTVYLLPPRKEMIIKGGRLHLTDKDPKQGLTLPIDHFFRSLALDAGPMARAIVLSGTGTDGSRGIMEVKRMGGVVIAESEQSAKFDGMPIAAQNTGVVAHVLRPEEMPAALLGSLDGASPRRLDAGSDAVETSEEAIFRVLRDECGLDFSHYKTTTVGRRIERRIALLKLDSIEDYVVRLRNDPAEVSALYEDLLIGVTRFFRDVEAFEAIATTIIPEIVEAVPPAEDVRVWVPGCATGEEAYSLTILLHEALVERGRPVNMKIFATDVHRRSLETAGQGFYSDASVADVSPERLRRYFTQRPNGYQVSQDIRQLIVFAPHNVFRDAPFTKLDLISCRNLLIYFQPHAQRAALSLFHFGLKTGGVLFLGSSESPGPLKDEYDAIDERHRIYKKLRDVRVTENIRLPFLREVASAPPASRLQSKSAVTDTQLLATYDALLDRYMPPSFLVSEDRELADTFGGAERYLRMKGRRPSHGFVELLPEPARPVVTSVLQKALSAWTPVRYTGLALDVDGQQERLDVVAEPVENRRAKKRQILVRFERKDARESEPQSPREIVAATLSGDDLVSDRVRTLEAELSYSRESLQASVEELEASNEELQATNEELVASNEELQSTNEELHSVNEELYTVNAEYQKKIFELVELNTDFKHLLDATDVGILFLDANLRIRKFTSKISGIFRFLPNDVGRKLNDFSHNMDRPELISDVRQVLATGAVVEAEVRDGFGKHYFLRVLPYRLGAIAEGADGESAEAEAAPRTIQGVVLTFTDISTLAEARSRLDKLSAIVESSDDAIVGKSLDGTITTWNAGAELLYGYTAAEAIGMNAMTYVPQERHDEEQLFLQKLARGERIDHVETIRKRKDGREIPVSITMSPIRDGKSTVVGISSIGRDITQLVEARRVVKEREEHIRLLLESMAEGVYGVDLNGVCTFANPSCARMLGCAEPQELVGKRMHAHHAPAAGEKDGGATEACPLEAGSREGRNVHADDHAFSRADGTTFPVEFWSHPVSVGGKLVGAVVTFIDIAERKKAEEEIRVAARRREEFLAMLSHELRNPLAAVLNATTLMSAPSVEPTMIEAARMVVQRQAGHMARLLDDLLDVARITRGAVGLQKRFTDLRDGAKAAAEALRPLFQTHKTELDLRMPDEPLPVYGDPDRLQQIHANLIGNAASYSDDGSRVLVSLRREGQEAVIEVKDRGIGIPPDLLPHIFELFVQGEQNLDRSKGGLGIGLTLVKMLVEMHGGSVQARSDGAGCGSEFTVRLPLSTDAPAEEPVRRVEQSVARKIMLVEDHDDSRQLLKILLETKGFSVVEASDGLSAISAIQRSQPDVALVDIGLPGMDGYEVARTIRSDSAYDGLVLVALTGYGRDSDVRRAKEAGFNHHLTKPVRPEVLEALLVDL
ncbi:MAG TPA: chemotaxis protein CheB [Polyangiaceae bacterium]|nr:chemotaxis protein CheB [Polyangiaceae bacterium]